MRKKTPENSRWTNNMRLLVNRHVEITLCGFLLKPCLCVNEGEPRRLSFKWCPTSTKRLQTHTETHRMTLTWQLPIVPLHLCLFGVVFFFLIWVDVRPLLLIKLRPSSSSSRTRSVTSAPTTTPLTVWVRTVPLSVHRGTHSTTYY